ELVRHSYFVAILTVRCLRSSLYRVFFLFFFFSSRRRHTRFSRDWSSDVCSSDLAPGPKICCGNPCRPIPVNCWAVADIGRKRSRSEERRVGKECRSRWSADHEKKKKRQKNKVEQGKE